MLTVALGLEIVSSVTLVSGRLLKLDCQWLIWAFLAVIVFSILSLGILAWQAVGRRLQFGLGTLLLAIVVLAVGPGSLVAFLRQTHSQRVAATRFVELDAQVAWAIDGRRGLNMLPGREYFSGVSSVSFLSCPPAGDKDLALFEELPELRGAIILGEGVSDRHLGHFENLTQLEFLILHFSEVEGPGLESLQDLSNLKVLGLANSRIDDESVNCLTRLVSLEVVGLTETDIGDQGLSQLAIMPHIVDLQLGSTRVTDAGLKHLERATHLKKLDLRGTQVSKRGVEQLRRRLPDCEITW